jgi:mono/diheme cytochrome c family protein/DNA-binding beta-propeller fold protein YncE
MRKLLPSLAAAILLGLTMPALAQGGAEELYANNCAECHGADRLGRTGPALLPQNLKRLRKKKAIGVIANGRPATQMPAFAEVLPKSDIAALAEYIFTPLAKQPVWGPQEIESTRNLAVEVDKYIKKPLYDADPLNLFVVVETGDHHVTILNGDTFEPIHRFKSRFALHGGPKFTPDGRYVFFGSRDGWVTKFDLYTLEVLAEVRAGINTRNIAISPDGTSIAVANYLPHSLVILDATDLEVEHIYDVGSASGESSRVSAVYQAPKRNSFIAALKDVPEIWEIKLDKGAELRRVKIDEPLDDFFFDEDYRHLLGSSRDGKSAVVVDIEAGKAIKRVDLLGLPHLGSGIAWEYQGRQVMATPHLKENRLTVIDLTDWSVVKTIETLGPGFFLRSHEKSAYAWTDVFFGPNKDAMHVIDKSTLEIVKTIRPEPGKTAAHVEFDRDGSHAIVSIWENDGAIVIYDAATLEEVKRIPMSKPSGKYNVWNKITFSRGTSH